MISRGQNFEAKPLNIVGSSTFGRYPAISIEKTYNMFMSDGWMIPYSGYRLGIPFTEFDEAIEGRGLHTSTKLNRMIGVFDNRVYLINLFFDQRTGRVLRPQVTQIGELQTSTGVVYITENNKPQVLISDNTSLYIYDTTLTPNFQVISVDFVPGFVDFHDTYFLAAAQNTNQWRLSDQNDGTSWPSAAANVGALQTKPDNTQAVVRFPSKGNMIFVFGKTVTEPWFDVGYQLFPYQRNTSFNIDYGCLTPTSIASMDELVVWLGINEKGGPIVMYSDGGMPTPITTDGFDYVLSNMQHPEDCQAFLYRQDGHIFYHINFYSDNLSFFVDFLKDGTKKIYHACDENNNYFIASVVAFFNNQYYFVSRNNGNLYAFDTIFTTYDGREIPRVRSCKNIRNIQQEPFIGNDCGFTIETGNTDYLQQEVGDIYLTTEDLFANPFTFITEDGKSLITEGGDQLIAQQVDLSDIYTAPVLKYITEGDTELFITEDNQFLITQDGNNLAAQQVNPNEFAYLIAEQPQVITLQPRVDMSISIDGGDHFSSYDAQYLPPIGQRKHKLAWWQLGHSNDLVCQFRFVGMGRFVATDGVVNIRK